MPPKGKGKKKAPTAAELAEARTTAAIVPCRASEKEDDTWSQFEERIQGISKTAIRENFDNAVPVLTKEDLEAILPETLPDSAFNDGWTREDEAALQQAWPSDPRYSDPRYSDPLRGQGKDGSMLRGFKLIVRMFRMSPLEIISPKYRLEWDTAARDVGPHWTAMFTNRLVNVAMYLLWERDVKLFTTALQYAVILRTEDTRPWLFKKPVNTPFFTTFQEVIGELKDKPISEVHEEVRSRLKRCGHQIPIFSEFLLSLESVVEIQPKTAIHDRSKKMYPVGLVDIKAVIEALDATDNFGFPAFLPLDFTATKVFEKRLRSEFDPPSSRDFAEYMRRAWLGYRRIEAQFNKGEHWEESRPAQVTGQDQSQQENVALRAKVRQLEAQLEAQLEEQLEAAKREQERVDQQLKVANQEREQILRH
ncbi:uncharacterized protein N0V96_003458 [Colletotrichum fioriniae]|uniref:uncharacterized protein n=1 Tax=Colletotrichum fioriniae TaxID=710243 RepID=UPI0032DAFD27|nr:hypothetical protein N0V96_003458 [Colletotrichum fioriniae]